MNLVKKITITLSTALIVASTSVFALEGYPTTNSAEQKKSQLEEQKVGYCWVYINGQWVWAC